MYKSPRVSGQKIKEERLAYSREEAARLLGIHLNTVIKYTYLGVIPARKLGNRWLIPAEELREWLRGEDGGKG